MVSERRFIPRICVIIPGWNHINERTLERVRTRSESDHMSLTSAGDKLSLDSLQVYSGSHTRDAGAFGFVGQLSRSSKGQEHS